jgi:hypothetical protein
MTKRLSLTLDDEDEAAIARFASPASAEHAALRAWAEHANEKVGDSPAESALLRLLVRAGAQALSEHSLDIAYARLSAEFDDAASDSRAARDRYLRRREHPPSR